MKFKRAFELMKNGAKIKLPSWGGYWYWDDEKKTVIMHTKDGKEMLDECEKKLNLTKTEIISLGIQKVYESIKK